MVPLGIIPKSENKTGEMVEIMSHLHEYVPAYFYTRRQVIPSTQECVEVPEANFRAILLGGDQLTCASTRGAKKAKVNSPLPKSRLDRLIPTSEDWHTKVILLEVGEY